MQMEGGVSTEKGQLVAGGGISRKDVEVLVGCGAAGGWLGTLGRMP